MLMLAADSNATLTSPFLCFCLQALPPLMWTLLAIVLTLVFQLCANRFVFFTGPRGNKWLRYRFWCRPHDCNTAPPSQLRRKPRLCSQVQPRHGPRANPSSPTLPRYALYDYNMIFSNVLVGIAVMTARFVMWLSVRATEATNPYAARHRSQAEIKPAPQQGSQHRTSGFAHAPTHSPAPLTRATRPCCDPLTRVAPIARRSSSASSAWAGSTSA